ncbi:MAG: hypothetical protein ACRC10_03765 [Thermoguttaceae bacterium]
MTFFPFTVCCKTCNAKIIVRDPNLVGKALACPKCKSVMRLLPEKVPTVDSALKSATQLEQAGQTKQSQQPKQPVNIKQKSTPTIASNSSDDFAIAVEQLLAAQLIERPDPFDTAEQSEHAEQTERSDMPILVDTSKTSLKKSSGGKQPNVVEQQGQVQRGQTSSERDQLDQLEQSDEFKRPPISLLERKTRKITLIAALILIFTLGIGYLGILFFGQQSSSKNVPATATKSATESATESATTDQTVEQTREKQETNDEINDETDGTGLDFGDSAFSESGETVLNGSPTNSSETTESTFPESALSNMVPSLQNEDATLVSDDSSTSEDGDVPNENGDQSSEIEDLSVPKKDETVFVPKPIRERTPLDVLERLKLPILRLKIDQAPFFEVVRTISDYSGIPLTLDLNGMKTAGFSFRTPVSLDLKNGTVADVLGELLVPLNLGFEVKEEQILLGCSERTPKRTKEDAEQSEWETGWKLLNQPITLHYYTVLPLSELFRGIEQFTELRILVNHLALNQAQAPLSELKGTLNIENSSLDSWFLQLFHSLEQVELEYRILDSNTIEITTADELIRPESLTVESFSYAEKLRESPEMGNVDVLVQLLKETVKPDSWSTADNDSGWGTIQVDPNSQTLIIRQSQPLQRQIRAWLQPTIPTGL